MPKDEEKVLLVQESDDSDLFARFDALGFFCIMGRLQEAREAKAESTKGA